MADINLNAATYEQIVTLLSQLATNYSNLAGTFYDVFYSNVAQDVSFKMFDDSGVLKDFTVKNLAKSNEYKITGNGNPNGNIAATMGTTYQDLKSGDLYIKTTNSDSNQGWEYFIKGSFFNNYLRQGIENPNNNVSAPVGTLYVNTNTATLYICIDKDNSKWAPVSSSFLEFADRNLSNITDNGKKVIDNEIKEELGTKAETITEDTKTNDYIPTALAVSQYVDPRFNTKQDKSNMASVLEDSTTTYPNSKVVYNAVSAKQDKSNMVTVLDSSTTTYPSCSAVQNAIESNTREVVGYKGITSSKQNVTDLSISVSNPDLTVTSTYNGIETPKTVVGTETTTLVADGTLDSSKYSGTESDDYYIRNGRLYSSSTNEPISDLVGWTEVAGTSYYSLGICNGNLYKITNGEVEQLELECTKVSGGDLTYWCYCITPDKKLYSVSGSPVQYNQIDGGSTGWIDISGYSDSSSLRGLGIKELQEGDGKGALYVLHTSGADSYELQQGTEWTSVKGQISDYSLSLAKGALGIRGGRLYAIYKTNPVIFEEIGASYGNSWVSVSSGFCYKTDITGHGYYAFAILGDENEENKGDLYRINIRKVVESSSSTVEFTLSKVDDIETKWVKISGNANNSSALVINEDGKLYRVGSSRLTQIGTSAGWTDIYDLYSSSYGICDGKMYKIVGTDVSLLYDLKVDDEIVSAQDYDLTITGDVQNNDTITLTYNTVPAYVVSRNSAYVVEQGSENPNGISFYRYRKWSDGTLEQWIHHPGVSSGGSLTLSLPSGYKDTKWCALATMDEDLESVGDSGGLDAAILLSDKKVNSIRVGIANGRQFNVYCYGMGA